MTVLTVIIYFYLTCYLTINTSEEGYIYSEQEKYYVHDCRSDWNIGCQLSLRNVYFEWLKLKKLKREVENILVSVMGVLQEIFS